jgi:hypothetical protein
MKMRIVAATCANGVKPPHPAIVAPGSLTDRCTPKALMTKGTSDLVCDVFWLLDSDGSLTTVFDFFLSNPKYYRVVNKEGKTKRPQNITVALSPTVLHGWSNAEDVPDKLKTALKNVAERLSAIRLKITNCIVRLQLPMHHDFNSSLRTSAACACTSKKVPEDAAPAQLWHADKVDMGLGQGTPTVRMMCQPASQVGHRYLGVRKKGEPANQCWVCLTSPAYILWPVAAGTVP